MLRIFGLGDWALLMVGSVAVEVRKIFAPARIEPHSSQSSIRSLASIQTYVVQTLLASSTIRVLLGIQLYVVSLRPKEILQH